LGGGGPANQLKVSSMIFAKIKNYFRKLPLLSRLSDESRIQQRYKVVDASILLREHQTSVNGEVVNISKTGMAFQHAEFLPHETFELDIIANDKTIAKNITRVAWYGEDKLVCILNMESTLKD